MRIASAVLLVHIFWAGRVSADVFIDLGTPGSLAQGAAEERMEAGDFQSFASSTLREDEDIVELEYSEDELILAYRDSGHFLALVPIEYTTTITAQPEGLLEFSYPWFSGLTVANKGEKEVRLRRAVEGVLRASFVGSVRAEGEPANPQWTDEKALLVTRTILDTLAEDEAQ